MFTSHKMETTASDFTINEVISLSQPYLEMIHATLPRVFQHFIIQSGFWFCFCSNKTQRQRTVNTASAKRWSPEVICWIQTRGGDLGGAYFCVRCLDNIIWFPDKWLSQLRLKNANKRAGSRFAFAPLIWIWKCEAPCWDLCVRVRAAAGLC